MAHVSREQLDPKTQRELIDTLESILSLIGKKGDMDSFLFSLLTETERVMLSKRLAIVLLHNEGMEEGRIAVFLNLTRQTVYRTIQSSKSKKNGYAVAFNALNRDMRLKQLRKTLLDLANYALSSSTGKINTKVF